MSDEIANILGVSKARTHQLKQSGFVVNESDAMARVIAPPHYGREEIVEISRWGERYVSVAEASRISGLSGSTLYRRIHKKQIQAVTSHGLYFLLKVTVQSLQHTEV